MADIIMEWAVHVFMFCVFGYLAYLFLDEYNEASRELEDSRAAEADGSMTEMYVALSPRAFNSLRLLAFVVFFLIGFLLIDWIVGLVLGVVAFFLPLFFLGLYKQKRILLLETQMVEGLELLKNSLKSGLTLQQSTELLVKEFPPPLSQEFNLVLAENRLGVDFVEGLHNMASRLDSNVVEILASGVGITKKCGGDLTEIFSNLADTIREQAKIDGKLKAVTAQGRFQGLILGAMPFALLGVLYFIDRAHVETLFSHQIGLYAFVGVIILVVMAQIWIRKLLDIDV